MRLIETSYLKTWASSKPAESRLPYFVRSLILATVQPDKLRMPSGDAVWLPGFDGVVHNEQPSRFVPFGWSVWELGTDADINSKADKDYEKRRADKDQDPDAQPVPRLDRSQTTFVFVTPRVWKGKDAWVKARKDEDLWKDVWGIDAVDLQDWLADAHAVQLQLAAELGIVPEDGLQSLDEAWEEWSHLSLPPGSEALVTVCREEQERALWTQLQSPPTAVTVRGHSPREAWGFVAASLRRLPLPDERDRICARTIVAADERVAGKLLSLSNHIVLIKQALSHMPGTLVTKGCHIIVCEGNDARPSHNIIALARQTHSSFAGALHEIGLPEEDADRRSRECGSSVTIWQRLYPHVNSERPPWAEGDTAKKLLPVLLAGRWSARSEADRAVLCRLARVEGYADLEVPLRELQRMDEAPIQKIDDLWVLTAPVDAFQLLAWRLDTSTFETFALVCQEVFGRLDPRVEIPPDEWLYMDIRGKNGPSAWLRSGLAETLLLIAERGRDAGIDCIDSPQAYVNEVIAGVPGLKDDWKLLASLRDVYPRLLEAAPRPFLDALERLLRDKPEDVRRLFVESDAFGFSPLHTGLLWGLEVLAWSPDYLSRVSLILANLAELDPGGRWVNRPINTLREIFLWWYPGTNAPIPERLAVLDLILRHAPGPGWDLLTKLLPEEPGAVAHLTAKPRWRDFGELASDQDDSEARFNYISGVIERTIDRLGADPERWHRLLDALRVISDVHREKALSLLDSVTAAQLPDEQKSRFWKMLREFVSRHRTFNNAQWALPVSVIDRIAAMLPRLAPGDLVEKHRWLFDTWFPQVPSKTQDPNDLEPEVAAHRRQAVKEIFESTGLSGLIELATTCELPGFIAAAAVPLLDDIGLLRSLVEQAVGSGEKGVVFASQVSGRACARYGGAWEDVIREGGESGRWAAPIVASLLIWWPDERRTWEIAERLGENIDKEYWLRKPCFVVSEESAEPEYQIERLLAVGRAVDVFDQVSLWEVGLSSALLLRVFDAALAATYADEGGVRRVPKTGSFGVRKLLDTLRERGDVPREALAKREYLALPLLGVMEAHGLSIHDWMAEDPKFFVEVICDVFRPEHLDQEQPTATTEEAATRARLGLTLLFGMKCIPGRVGPNEIDPSTLLSWIQEVRRGANDADRLTIAEQRVGEVLAHAPPDPEDQAWPHRAVRDAIETLLAEQIDVGLQIGRINMRGTYMKDPYEGGAQERALASNYRKWARTCASRWPHMSQVLERIAETWDDYARREDADAEKQKLE